jgi:hypothetical protein
MAIQGIGNETIHPITARPGQAVSTRAVASPTVNNAHSPMTQGSVSPNELQAVANNAVATTRIMRSDNASIRVPRPLGGGTSGGGLATLKPVVPIMRSRGPVVPVVHENAVNQFNGRAALNALGGDVAMGFEKFGL